MSGGDTVRLLHGHTDECLTISAAESRREERRSERSPNSLNYIYNILFHNFPSSPTGLSILRVAWYLFRLDLYGDLKRYMLRRYSSS